MLLHPMHCHVNGQCNRYPIYNHDDTKYSCANCERAHTVLCLGFYLAHKCEMDTMVVLGRWNIRVESSICLVQLPLSYVLACRSRIAVHPSVSCSGRYRSVMPIYEPHRNRAVDWGFIVASATMPPFNTGAYRTNRYTVVHVPPNAWPPFSRAC